MSQNDSFATAKDVNRKRQRLENSKIPVPVKSAVGENLEKGDGNDGKAKKVIHEVHLGCRRPVKITEPHQLASPESCPFVPSTGSKGDHVGKPSKCGDSGDDSNGKILHSLDVSVEPHFLKEDLSFQERRSSSIENSDKGESRISKNKDEPNVWIGDGTADDHNSEGTTEKGNSDLTVIPKKKTESPPVILKANQAATNSRTFDASNICEIFPQVLLLIPDVDRRGGYTTQLNIVNKSKNLLAYKICVNQSAAANYIIQPMYGVIEPSEMLLVDIKTRRQDGNRIGGFCQKSAKKDRLEIKTIESIGVSSKNELCKFWNVAELQYSQLIQTTVIETIKVLEPGNMAMLKVLDEGPERSFVQNALEEKYNRVLFPQMVENREWHSIENELIVLENRSDSIWHSVRNISLYLLSPRRRSQLRVICATGAIILYFYFAPNASNRVVDLSHEPDPELLSYKVVTSVINVNRAIFNFLYGRFF